MELTFSHDDLARMAAASRVLASPLAYATTDAWRAESVRAVAAFAGAESGWFLMPPDARIAVTHHTDPDAERAIDALLAPQTYRNQSTGDPVLDDVILYTVRDRPAAWDLHTADRATGGTGAMWRSAWYTDLLLRYGAGDLSALYAFQPTCQVILSVHGFHHDAPIGAATARIALLSPALCAGLDTLDRAGAHRGALDTLDVPAAFFDADGRETHRTPALSRLLAADPDAARLADALAATARHARAHAFPRQGETAGPTTRRVHTPRAAYTLRATRLAPGALLGTDAFLVTVQRTGAALPDGPALRARYGLTRREADVVRLVARGLSNADAARELSVSAHTVRHQLEAAMAKLGLSGRGREALAARLTGLDPG